MNNKINESNVLKEDTPFGKQNLLMSDNLEGIVFNGNRYNTRQIVFHGITINLASESLNEALMNVIEANESSLDLYNEAQSIDEKICAYIPENILVSYTDDAIGKWCLDNQIEIVDSNEIDRILKAEEAEYVEKNIPQTTLSDFLSSLGGFPNCLQYEIVNNKIHIIDLDSHIDLVDTNWSSFNYLSSQFFKTPADVILAIPDSVFESLYEDMTEQYSIKYPELWKDFEKRFNGGLLNCNDFYEFQKLTGDTDYNFVKYVVHPELIQLDEEKLKQARETEFFIYTYIDGKKKYIADWSDNGEPIFTSSEKNAFSYKNLDDAINILEPWDSPVRDYANSAELLHIEEHKLSPMSWEQLKKVMKDSFHVSDKKFESVKKYYNSDSMRMKTRTISDLLLFYENENSDIFQGFNLTTENIPLYIKSKFAKEFLNETSKEIVCGNLLNKNEIESNIKKNLWNNPLYQKAIIDGIVRFPEEHILNNGRKELNAAGFKVLFEKEFYRELDFDSAVEILNYNKGNLSYDKNCIYQDERQITLVYMINNSRKILEQKLDDENNYKEAENIKEKDCNFLKYLDSISLVFDIPASMQREKLAQQFLNDVKNCLSDYKNNPLKAFKVQLQKYQENKGLGNLNEFFNEIGIRTDNQSTFINDIKKITGVRKKTIDRNIKNQDEIKYPER